MSFQVPISLDVGSILLFVLSTLLAVVWHSLRTQFKMTLDQVESKCLANDQAIKDRLTRLEDEIGDMPQKLGQVLEKINRLEIMLASHYASKQEMREALTTREELLEMIRSKRGNRG